MTTSATQTPTTTELAPYLFLYGRCDEALAFYQGVFGGTYDVQRYSDGPMADQVSPDFRDKVMHAHFHSPGVSFMAADGREAKAVDPDAGNVSLALTTVESAETDRLFNALAQGGEIAVPLVEIFFGSRFGMLSDRFGTQWMIVGP